MKRLRESVMTALKRIFELECEEVTRLKKTAEWGAFFTKYSHGAEKEAWNEYGMKNTWDRCYMHKITKMLP